MATKIRLKRFGGRHDPHYRIVVADSRRQRDGRAIEELGHYSPTGSSQKLELNAERVQYWLGVGAIPTETVQALLVRAGVLEGPQHEDVEDEAAAEAPEVEDDLEETVEDAVDEAVEEEEEEAAEETQ